MQLVAWCAMVIADTAGYLIGRLITLSLWVPRLVTTLSSKIDLEKIGHYREKILHGIWIVFFQIPVITRAPILVSRSSPSRGGLVLDTCATTLFVSSVVAIG